MVYKPEFVRQKGITTMIGELKAPAVSTIRTKTPSTVGNEVSVIVGNPNSENGLLALSLVMRFLLQTTDRVYEGVSIPHLTHAAGEFLMMRIFSENPTDKTVGTTTVYVAGNLDFLSNGKRWLTELSDEEKRPFHLPKGWKVYKDSETSAEVYYYIPDCSCGLVESVCKFMLNPERVIS